MNEGMNERTKEPTFIEHLCANLCFVCTTALRGWSIITPQARKWTEVQRGAAICPGSHTTRAGLGQESSDVLGLAPLAASLHGDRKISLHATAVGQALTLPMAHHPGSPCMEPPPVRKQPVAIHEGEILVHLSSPPQPVGFWGQGPSLIHH